jgi:predicted AAA+ superfamily ATPase
VARLFCGILRRYRQLDESYIVNWTLVHPSIGRHINSQLDAIPPPFPRHIRSAIDAALADTPVVCLLGPRQCGKTTLVQTFSNHREYFSLDEEVYATNAQSDPVGLLTFTPHPKTIDEVQRAPLLLQALKTVVDNNRRPGQFLLTGSANLLLMPQLGDSLAGRVEYVYLHPLTDAEKARTPGNFLRTLINHEFATASGAISADKSSPPLPERLVAGGFPEPLTRLPARARQWQRQYLNTLIERDVRDIARIRDVSQLRRLLEMLALQNAELLNVSALSNALGVRRETIDHYLAILERLFLVRPLLAWHKHDANRLIKSPKMHFVDSGVATMLAGLTTADWIQQRDRFGHILESYVVQQVVAQAGWTDPDLRFWHYRDKDQVEVDLVITRGKETWGVEVKAAATVQSRDGAGLLRLSEQCGKSFRGGILLYSGTAIVPLSNPKILAVPLQLLWQL